MGMGWGIGIVPFVAGFYYLFKGVNEKNIKEIGWGILSFAIGVGIWIAVAKGII